MPDTSSNVPVKTEEKGATPPATGGVWQPFDSLRREVDRLFDDFQRSSWRHPLGRSMFDIEPIWRRAMPRWTAPAADIAEKDNSYEITVELPGLDESNIDVKLSGDMLTITGEKKEEKEEKKKDYYLSERRYGSVQRSFRVPEGVDTDKIAAGFKKGVLTVTLPKNSEALKKEKTIAVKAS